MDDLPDYDLRQPSIEPDPLAPARRPAVGLWRAVGALLLTAGGAAYVVFRAPASPGTALVASPAPVTRTTEPPPVLGGKAEAIQLPPLDETDGLVRRLVQGLTHNPDVAAWLGTSGLILNFAIVVTNLADGATPARQLRVLRPTAAFGVVERAGRIYLDPRSYQRYDSIARAVDAIDPSGAARLYATLKPRIQDAYGQVGIPGRSLDQTVQAALLELLETPTVAGQIPLLPKGIGYRFADDRLEGLTPGQRQLLRMGPANMRLIQQSLRRIALALGVSERRLPPVAAHDERKTSS